MAGGRLLPVINPSFFHEHGAGPINQTVCPSRIHFSQALPGIGYWKHERITPRRPIVEEYFACNTGMKSVDAKLRKLNRDHRWMDYQFAQKVNEHLYRMAALHHGGDCYIAGFAGAKPNDRLWTVGRNLRNNVFWNVYVSLEVLVDRARVKHARKHSRRIRIIRASSGGG